MTMDSDGKRAAVLKMLSGYHSSSRLTESQINAYHQAMEGRSLDAVRRACQQFFDGNVTGHDNAFLPTVPELAAKAREWDEAISSITTDRVLEQLVSYPIGGRPPPGYIALGEFEERRKKLADEARAIEASKIKPALKRMDEQ